MSLEWMKYLCNTTQRTPILGPGSDESSIMKMAQQVASILSKALLVTSSTGGPTPSQVTRHLVEESVDEEEEGSSGLVCDRADPDLEQEEEGCCLSPSQVDYFLKYATKKLSENAGRPQVLDILHKDLTFGTKELFGEESLESGLLTSVKIVTQ